VEAAVTGRELVCEYMAALRRMTHDDARTLVACGVSWRTIRLVCAVPTLIAVDATRERYEPDPAGKPAWVLPICVRDLVHPEWIETGEPETVVSKGATVDLITFTPMAPGRWALRLGEAPVLGAIEPQYLGPAPVPVHRDVTDWLRAGCRGIMLLTRDPCEAGRILRQCETVEAEDVVHAAELRHLIERPPYIDTSVIVRATSRRAA
jgi:hypothetical protein